MLLFVFALIELNTAIKVQEGDTTMYHMAAAWPGQKNIFNVSPLNNF